MPFLLIAAAFGFGLFLSVKGAGFLVAAAVRIKNSTGAGEFLIGATLMAVITTLPETMVALASVAAGETEMAVGSAVGSIVFNISVVLSVYLLARPVAVNRREILWKALLLFGVFACVALFGLNNRLGLAESAVLFLFFLLFIFINRKGFPSKTEGLSEGKRQTPLWGLLAAGVIMLILGAFLVVSYGEAAAEYLAIPKNIMAIVLISAGISLPELFIAVTAVRNKHGGIALGNIIGSCILNCTMLLGSAGMISAVNSPGLPISSGTLTLSLPFMLAFAVVALVPILIRGKTSRIFGGVLLAMYVVYLILLCC